MFIMPVFSFIILTFNEEIHLKRLLSGIAQFNTDIFIIDSGSTDNTILIAEQYGAKVIYNKFENHPKQWDFALKNCPVKTEWLICLDADHFMTESLIAKLNEFKTENIEKEVNGIFFNRHNYFKGKRLKYGGYRNFYLQKMFRYGKGVSDLNENMDHRFIIEGRSIVWKDAILNEENLKENNIDFWVQKHIKYSSLVAEEEYERMQGLRIQTVKPDFFGTIDEKKAFLKKLWWSMPLYLRPFLYFIYRFIFRLGFLESRQGMIFHFLQAFWFRLMVDIKIDELKKHKS